MTNPGKDVRAGHEWAPYAHDSCCRCGDCCCVKPKVYHHVEACRAWHAAHVASLPAQEPAAPAALASQVPAQRVGNGVLNKVFNPVPTQPEPTQVGHVWNKERGICSCGEWCRDQAERNYHLVQVYPASELVTYEQRKASAPVPAQVKPATCCNRHSDADIAFNKEMHAWVPDIMTYPNPMGRCLCGYGRLYKMSFTEWELHVQGDPRVKQQSAPVPAQLPAQHKRTADGMHHSDDCPLCEYRSSAPAAASPPVPWKEIGNVLDHWEQLSNDLRGDESFENLNKALQKLYNAVGGATK